ncbi:MAG: hypothetical protein ACP5D4_20525, partial [Baaleninema sp.]
MRYFCTYFDHRYLPKGLTLYNSLKQHSQSFELWVLCLDKLCYEVLEKLALPHLKFIELETLESADPDLLKAKQDRTLVEYYFTCTPCFPRYIFDRESSINLITYLDSDLFFFSDIEPIYQELGERSIAIIEHRFPPKLEGLKFNGIYNVGWVSFRRDSPGLECLNWWRERCLEWCHDYHQDGKFADQKYLDDWPVRFNNVAVLQHKGANLAPWNVDRYDIQLKNNRIWVDEQPLVFYHFHGFKEKEPSVYDPNLNFYRVEKNHQTLSIVYQTYIQSLNSTKKQVVTLLPQASLGDSVRFKKIPALTAVSSQSVASSSQPVMEPNTNPQPAKIVTDALSAIEQAFQQPQPSPTPTQENLPLSQLIPQATQLLQTYQQNPLNRDALDQLRRIRTAVTQHLLNLPTDQLHPQLTGQLGQTYKQLWQSSLKNEPLTDTDRTTIAQLSQKLSQGLGAPQALQTLFAAALYGYPHQFDIQYQNAPIPSWMTGTYLNFMFESPRLFKDLGEVDAYHQYFTNWTTYLHDKILSNPDNPTWKTVTQAFANLANLTPLCFSHRDQREVQQKRAAILERYLQQAGSQLDYQFPPRPQNRKLRFGVLCLNYLPTAETFTTIPAFEHLDRNRFEVYLYSLQTTGHPHEQYCRERADKFTTLPANNLPNMVNAVRSDDLDVLLIGTNITARSYPLTLLSLHRLARIQTTGLSAPTTT